MLVVLGQPLNQSVLPHTWWKNAVSSVCHDLQKYIRLAKTCGAVYVCWKSIRDNTRPKIFNFFCYQFFWFVRTIQFESPLVDILKNLTSHSIIATMK